MKRYSSQSGELVLTSLLYCFSAFILFYAFKILSRQLLGPREWTAFLNWRLPVLLASSSILLRWISRHLPSSIRGPIYVYDGLSWLAAPIGILIQAVAPFSSDPQLWFGLFFLTLWAVKTLFLAISLLSCQKDHPIPALMVFISMIWFLGMYGAWHAPVHRIHGDEPHYLLMTHSLVHDGDLNLYNEFNEKAYQVFYSNTLEPKPSDHISPGVIYSRGLGATYSFILAPSYAIGGFRGTQVFTIICAAFLIAQLYLLILPSCPNPVTALIAVMFVASTSPVLNYSSLIYPDIFGALLIVLGLRALQIPPSSKSGKSVPSYIVIISAVLLFTKFRYFVPVLLLLIPLFSREIKRVQSGLACFAALALLGAVYVYIDRVFMDGDLFINRFGGFNRIAAYMPDLQNLRVFPGLLLDQESGLLILSPVYLLAVAGIRLYRGKKNSLYWFSILGIPLTALSLSGHFAWHSLPTPPLRYLLPVLPPTALFLAFSLDNWKKRSLCFRFVAVICMSVSWLHAWFTTLKPDWQINLASGTAGIFADLAAILKIPIPCFLPSVIRPNAALLPWTLVFFCILLVFWRQSARDGKKRFVCLTPLIILPVLLVILFSGRLFPCLVHYRTHHLEDRFRMIPDGGMYFPEKRDPFHHRELSYGWTFTPGSSMVIPFQGKEDDFVCVTRCRLTDSWLPQKLHIHGADAPKAVIVVTSKQWKQYAFKINPPASIQSMEVVSPEINSGSVAVDYVKIIPKSALKFALWNKLADFSRVSGFKKLPLYFTRNALLVFPGDTWYELRNRYVPGAQPRRPELARLHPLPEDILDNIFHDAVAAGWEKAQTFESLFGFSFRSSIPEAQLEDYAVKGVLQGHQPATHMMTRMDSFDDTNGKLMMMKSIAFYLQGNSSESVKILDTILTKGHDYPMRLTEPSRHLSIDHPLYTFFHDMENNPGFTRHARRICNQHIVRSLNAYEENDITTAVEHFGNFYLSDHAIFLNHLPHLDQDYLVRMFQSTSRIHSNHIKSVADQLIRLNRVEAALAAAKYCLRMNPDDIDSRWLTARALYHQQQFNCAKQFCLENIALFHKDDSSRWLLEKIKEQVATSRSRMSRDSDCRNAP